MIKVKEKYFILFALTCAGMSAAGRTLYVSPAGTNDYAGYYPDWLGAATMISAAVTRADTSGDLIWVTNATYRITTNINVTSNITIRSWNNGNLDRTNTIVDGQRSNRCFYINNSGAVIAGFTITNGSSSCGGGVYIDTSGGTVSNCVITDNRIGSSTDWLGGGGVYMKSNAAVVRDCVIQRNIRSDATYYGGGGGVFLRDGGLLKDCEIIGNSNGTLIGTVGGGLWVYNGGTVDHCLITNNITSGEGGGVYLYNGVILMTNCTVAGNTAAYSCAGVSMVANAVAVVTDCVISNNTQTGTGDNKPGGLAVGTYGLVRKCQIVNNRSAGGVQSGGIYCSGSATVTACIVQGNYPDGVSGAQAGSNWRLVNCLIRDNTNNGVAIKGGTPIIVNCTIVNNARGIYDVGNWDAYPTTCQVVNTIVYLNTITNYAITYAYNKWLFTNSCTTPLPAEGSGNFTNAPLFANTNVGNYRLDVSSPCINAGVNEAWMGTAVDLDARRRIDRFSGRVDIGCYEFLHQGTLFSFH